MAPGLIVQVLKRSNDSAETPSRVGFTVSRKVGNAVERNRARRRLRAAAEKVMGSHARAGYDFVVIGRKVTLKRPFSSLLGDLETSLKKLDAYR